MENLKDHLRAITGSKHSGRQNKYQRSFLKILFIEHVLGSQVLGQTSLYLED